MFVKISYKIFYNQTFPSLIYNQQLLYQLKSKYNPDGTEKTGHELEIANIAEEFYTKKNKLGTYIITDEGLFGFEMDKLYLKKRLQSGDITQEEFDV